MAAVLGTAMPVFQETFPERPLELATAEDPEGGKPLLNVRARFSGSPEDAFERLDSLYAYRADLPASVRGRLTLSIEFN